MTTVARLTQNNGRAIAAGMRAKASRLVRKTCFAIEADIVAGMTAPHSGRIYGEHQASAPGEMPAVDTSTLLGSLGVEAEPGSTYGEVYVSPDYALPLEYGSPANNVAPRPFMTPAAEGQRRAFERDLRRLFDGVA